MTLIRIDNQNDIRPFIGRKGELVYSEQRGSLFIKTKSGIVEIGSGSSTQETDPVFNSWLATPPNVSTFVNDVGYLTSETDPVYSASSWFSTTNNSIDWDTAYSWGNHVSAGYVPQTRTLTINGTTYDLSTDRSWTIPTSSLPTLTSGSILFSDGSTIAQNNSNLFWDNTNKRLGIGTASPVCSFVLNAPDAEAIPVRIQKTNGSLRFYISAGSGGSPIISFARGGSLWGIGSRVNYSDAFLISTFGDLSGSTHAVRIEKSSRNIGLSLPNAPATATLHIRAGTASAGSAPLKFTSGTNLTTPENGAFEFDGTNLYFTVGGVRKIVNLT